MSTVRCPQCQLLTTDAEQQAGACPECGAALPIPVAQTPPKTETPSNAPSLLPLLFAGALAIVALLVGGAGGYALATIPWIGDEADNPSLPTVEDAKPQDAEAVKLAKRLKDAQLLLDKQRLVFVAHEKQREESRKGLDERVKTLESDIAKAADDLTAQKKQTAAEKARAESAERDADMLRAEGKKPQDERIKLLEAAAKKQQKDLEAQTKLTQLANARADAAQRNTDQVRNLGERQLEKQRQESQRQLEQLRQENQRQLEQVRQQLRLQQQMTDQARADANRHKQAADELRRKVK